MQPALWSCSLHSIVIILDLRKRGLAKCISGWSIQDLVDPIVTLSEDAELQLLLLLLHLVLAL